jgi:hypothetical protein
MPEEKYDFFRMRRDFNRKVWRETKGLSEIERMSYWDALNREGAVLQEAAVERGRSPGVKRKAEAKACASKKAPGAVSVRGKDEIPVLAREDTGEYRSRGK